ncbi:MAG: hypothetical protein CM15mP83_2670 [Flavobacteriaceae bacterium]|nr:MAG: hypothetical protein CM15mP83_2670 [Flavobacteriaceae bacterium]
MGTSYFVPPSVNFKVGQLSTRTKKEKEIFPATCGLQAPMILLHGEVLLTIITQRFESFFKRCSRFFFDIRIPFKFSLNPDYWYIRGSGVLNKKRAN